MLKSKSECFVEKCAFATCFIKKPSRDLISCPYCLKSKYCSQKCLSLDWEAWHKFSCPDSLSNQGSLRTNFTGNSANKILEDYEPLDIDFEPYENGKKSAYEEKYRDEYQFVRDRKTHQSYLMKIIEKAKFQSETLKDQIIKGFRCHQRILIHPHVIRLFHFFEDESNFYLIHEFLDRQLHCLFLKRKKLIEREAFLFFVQITLALDFLHKKSILHKRLTFSTTFIDTMGQIKLSEFGQMIDFSDSKSLEHLSPETLECRLFTPQNDVWSLGLMFYEMIHGHKPFRNGELRFASFVSDECADLITKMLNRSAEERIGVDKILCHDWMRKYEDVYRIKIREFVHKEREERSSEGGVRSFVPSFMASKFSKRSSVLMGDARPDFLGSFYNRISFADEGIEKDEEKEDFYSKFQFKSKSKKSRSNKNELESLIKWYSIFFGVSSELPIQLSKKEKMSKMREKSLKEEKAINSSFLDLRENLEHDKISTNLDTNPQEMGTLSEREALKDPVPIGYK